LAASDNIALGRYALKKNTASNNIAIGPDALSGTTSGYMNTALGGLAMYNNTSGCCNTSIGRYTGVINTTGSNNTFLGTKANGLAAGCSNTITLGNNAITTIRAQVTSITALSDYRDKAYIETLPVGLEFLRQVRPVKFTWKMRDGSKVGQKESGFIAQELKQVADNSSIKDWLDGLVISNEDESRFEAAPGKLLPLLVKAIQELADQNDVLTARIVALETIINKQS
jgi:hypothetical protein